MSGPRYLERREPARCASLLTQYAIRIAAEDDRLMMVHPLYAVSWGQRPRPDHR